MVAVSQGDQAAAERVASRLANLAENPDWAALVAAIRRVLDGEREQAFLLNALDPIDTAYVPKPRRR